MSAKKISPTLPAQARLLKLKKDLKESLNKKCNTEIPSRITVPSESNKKCNAEVPARMAASSGKEGSLNKKQKKDIKSCKCKDVNSTLGKKRNLPKTQPSTSSENSNNNSQSSISLKIRKIIGKLTSFSNNQEVKVPKTNSSPSPHKISSKKGKCIGSSSFSKISEGNISNGVCQTQPNSLEGTAFFSGRSSPKKKPGSKTETSSNKLLKRKKNSISPNSKANKLSVTAEATLKKIVKNPKLLNSAEVIPKNIRSVPSVGSLNSISFKVQKKKVNKSSYNYHSQALSSPRLNESENYRDVSPPVTNECKADFFENELYNNLTEDEAMEWEPVKESILRSTRDEIYAGNVEQVLDSYNRNFEIAINKEDDKCVYFVVDTNVLIQSLNLIKNLAQSKIRGFTFIVMVPWQVLKELDKLKSAKEHSLANCARKASKFLSELQGGLHKIIFQKQSKYFEDCPQVLVEVPDDHLIKCCCQLKNENKFVILLSNDNNLRVKASATGNFPSVPDSWVSDLMKKDLRPCSVALHCFESEPKETLDESSRVCAQYLLKTTKLLAKFLFDVIKYAFKSKHGQFYELWLPKINMSLKECFVCCSTLALLEPFSNQILDVWNFYSEKNTYIGIKGIDVDKLGRNCILLAKSLNHLVLDITTQFDKDMGFLKTGNFSESTFSYTSASSQVAQTYFKRMEDKFNCNLAFLNQLISKLISQNVVMPDITPMISMIDKNINVANEASTAFLLIDKDEEMPLNAPEIIIFHKILLNFLEINQDENSLPLFTPEDIVTYINQERSFLYPAAIQWLSDIRRQFMEFKSVLRKY